MGSKTCKMGKDARRFVGNELSSSAREQYAYGYFFTLYIKGPVFFL